MPPEAETAAQDDAPERSDIVADLFDEAYKINEEMGALLKRRNAVRNSLRNLRDTGRLSDKDVAEIEELYPTRARRASGDDEPESTDTGEGE